jgi:hypothetical protein
MDEFQFWRDSLAGKSVVINEGRPESGYYRLRQGRNGAYLPVAIWNKDGIKVARVGDAMKDPSDVWTYCADQPVRKEDAMEAFRTGAWPGDVPDIGHNSSDVSLAERIKDYATLALDWLQKSGIKDTVSKDKASNFRAKLIEFREEVKEMKDKEKRPHLDANEAIEKKYKPLITEADSAAATLREALTVYMRKEDQEAEEERKRLLKEAQDKALAERQRIEKEHAEKMRVDPIAAMTDAKPVLPEIPIELPPIKKIQAGGQRGRKTSLRTQTKYVMVDYDKALLHCKDHETVRAAVEKVACAQAKAGAAVPGIEAVEERVAV